MRTPPQPRQVPRATFKDRRCAGYISGLGIPSTRLLDKNSSIGIDHSTCDYHFLWRQTKYNSELKLSAVALEMITKYITDVSTKFNPFKNSAKTCRSFLAHLPSNARQIMKVNTQILPRHSQEPSSLSLKFSTSCFFCTHHQLRIYRICELIE